MIKYISRFFINIIDSYKPDYIPVYPYDQDPIKKRQQLWDNLQHGLLFEDMGTFIAWQTPYSDLDNYKEQRRDSEDRYEWYFGKRLILDGYELPVEAMKWSGVSSLDSVKELNSFLGFDYQGLDKFNHLKEYLTNLLGEPTVTELKKWNDFDLGTIQWSNKKVNITLTGIEQFAAKYFFKVGLDYNND